MGRLTERRKVIDILEKFNFFQGQRAGRELWNDKPIEVQEQDLDNLNRDVRTIRDYIWDLEHELKTYKDLEEQGLLQKLPLAKEDAFWEINRGTIPPSCYKRYAHSYQHCVYVLERLGKTCFLTEAEAEKALAEMEK